MLWYESTADEVEALRRAATRAACRVRSIRIEPPVNGAPVRVRGSIDCADGWAAARLLLALAYEDARTPGARWLALELRENAQSEEDFARAIHAFVLERVRFVREVGEDFQTGGYTLWRGAGDCDDHFRLACAIAVAGGLPAALAILSHGGSSPPAHAVVVYGLGGGWVFGESTVRAFFGEPPNDAAARLGLTRERSDIAREVTIMTDKDLAPVPAGFLERNKPATVRRDAVALQRLGYLDGEEAIDDATDRDLRRAVLAFQQARGIAADGLLGPGTRAELAAALGQAGIGALVTSASSDVTDEFLREVHAFAARWRAKGASARAIDWLAVWFAESGVSNIANKAGHDYAGLNQMGARERQESGFTGTAAEWLSLSLVDQLPFVERFYESAVRFAPKLGAAAFRDASTIYLANIAPAHLSHAEDPDFAIYTSPSREYRANAGAFDLEKKGFIAIRDLLPFVERSARGARWSELKARSEAIALEPPPIASSSTGAGLALALFAAGGAIAWWMVRS